MNFTQCREIFNSSRELLDKYRYNGTIQGIYRDLDLDHLPMLVTVQGCRDVCGTGAEYYSWQDASSTISTWILPLISLLLQAPYESNQFKATMFALARWVGSPIASLSYILWNIDITGRCAIMVDNAIMYGGKPDENSQYEQIRDSFYLLSVMNQYSVIEGMKEIESERLLRIVLFSNSLRLKRYDDESRNLVRRRRKLARTIREFRRRSVVPIFVSLPWFLFSLVISIQAAFGQLGSNATAHNLALGLLMAWLPTLVLFSIVDRNPVGAEAIRHKLNRLVEAVRDALLDPTLRRTYIHSIHKREEDFEWTAKLHDGRDFFRVFAGQGRARWHYGCGASILAGIEETNLIKFGRCWLDDKDKARTSLVKGPKRLKGLQWFDGRGLRCILSAMIYVSAAVYGAFIISYATPTVGLGCRSGGYLVFYNCALIGLIIEGVTWWLVPKGKASPKVTLWSSVDRRLSQTRKLNYVRLRFSRWWGALTARDVVEQVVLRPLEVLNALWLLYCLLSQTFGLYQTCDCQSSTWGPGGSYMDFEDFEFYRAKGVGYYWGVAVALTNTVMVISFISAAVHWGEQSHLATEDYQSSLKGLQRTQYLRQKTRFIRRLPHRILRHFVSPFIPILTRFGYVQNPKRGRIEWCPATSALPATVVTPPSSAPLKTPGTYVSQAYSLTGASLEPPREPPRSHLPSTPVLETTDDEDYGYSSGGAPMSREGSAESYYGAHTWGGAAALSPYHARTKSTGSLSGISPRASLAPLSEAEGARERRRSSGHSDTDQAPLLGPEFRGRPKRAVHEDATLEMGLPPIHRRRVRSPRESFSDVVRRNISLGIQGDDRDDVVVLDEDHSERVPPLA